MLPLLLSAALLTPADNPEPPTPVKGPPPTILVGQLDQDGNFLANRVLMRPVTETRFVQVNVNGKEVLQRETVTRMIKAAYVERRDLSKATATTASGKKLGKKDLAARLGKPTAVVFSADGQPVDKGFLALFKADTIVIVAPVAAPVTPPPPPPPVAK